MGDAFHTTVLVAAEAALAWALAAPWLGASGAARLRGPLAASLLAGLLVGAQLARAAAARGLTARDVALPLARWHHLFGLALLAGAYLARGREARAPAARLGGGLAGTAALAAGLLFCLPEGAALARALGDLSVLRGAAAPVWLGAALGLVAAAAGGLLVEQLLVRARLGAAFPLSALLALLFALKMAGPAAAAVEIPPLAAALTDVVARTIHDLFHLGFVLFLLPDHPFLRDGVYQLILASLDPRLHAAITAAALTAPLAAAWVAFAHRASPDVPPATRPPDRRIVLAGFRRASRLAGTSFAVAVALAAAAIWSFHARSEELYDPAPEPVVDDGQGWVIAPLGGPLAGSDERMRKFVYSADGHAITFLVVRRPDGALAAALDLCEICQPKGYAQLGRGYVFCKYCKTPIPVSTVGQAGGCNPIPLPGAAIQGSALRIPRAALLEAWKKRAPEKG